jgi:hypothetical protein
MTRFIGPAALFILTTLYGLSAPTTYAADVAIVSNTVYFPDKPGCTVRLTEEIASGDLEKLRAAFQQVNSGSDIAFGSLCLNSLGGSYTEGLKIADWMLSQNVFTVVEPNALCFSACAIIFMTGGDFEDGRSLERYIHPSSQLGFHAPFIIKKLLPDRAYDKDTLAEAYQLGVRAIRDLAKLGQQHNVSDRFLPKALIAELLDKGPDEAFMVDTAFKLVRLDIRLYGYQKPTVSIETLGNACLNFLFKNGLDLSLDDAPPPWVSRRESVRKKGSDIWFGGFGGEGSE